MAFDSRKKQMWAWAFYDWANSAFATVVIAGFFPIAFKQHWGTSLSVSDSTFYLGLANSIGSLIIMLTAPILGAMADQGGARKRFLLFCTLLGILMTSCMYFIAEGQWVWAVVLYIFAMLGFMGGNTFYDALLPEVAHETKYDMVSSIGYALGYLGGGILLAICVMINVKPEILGLSASYQLVKFSFILTAIWWLVFTVPLILYVKETLKAERSPLTIAKQGIQQLLATLKQFRQNRALLLFLLAYWLYIDGVDTIIRMAVDYGLALGFPSNSLIIALLITQFVGFPATLVLGRLGERYGPKAGIIFCIGIYMLITFWAYFMDEVWEFFAMAVSVGLVQGGIQALSRSLYARLIPKEYAGEYFGFYNMLGKFAAVIGPALVGIVSMFTGNPRLSILAILFLFIPGLLLLCRVQYLDRAE